MSKTIKQTCKGCAGRDKIIESLAKEVDKLEKKLAELERGKT